MIQKLKDKYEYTFASRTPKIFTVDKNGSLEHTPQSSFIEKEFSEEIEKVKKLSNHYLNKTSKLIRDLEIFQSSEYTPASKVEKKAQPVPKKSIFQSPQQETPLKPPQKEQKTDAPIKTNATNVVRHPMLKRLEQQQLLLMEKVTECKKELKLTIRKVKDQQILMDEAILIDEPKFSTQAYFNNDWSGSENKALSPTQNEKANFDINFQDTSVVELLSEAAATISSFHQILQTKKKIEQDLKVERNDAQDQTFQKEEGKIQEINKPSLQDFFDEKVIPVHPLDDVHEVVLKAQKACKIFDEEQKQKRLALRKQSEQPPHRKDIKTQPLNAIRATNMVRDIAFDDDDLYRMNNATGADYDDDLREMKFARTGFTTHQQSFTKESHAHASQDYNNTTSIIRTQGRKVNQRPNRTDPNIELRFSAEDRSILTKRYAEKMDQETEKIEKQIKIFQATQDSLKVFGPGINDFRLKSLRHAKLYKARGKTSSTVKRELKREKIEVVRIREASEGPHFSTSRRSTVEDPVKFNMNSTYMSTFEQTDGMERLSTTTKALFKLSQILTKPVQKPRNAVASDLKLVKQRIYNMQQDTPSTAKPHPLKYVKMMTGQN